MILNKLATHVHLTTDTRVTYRNVVSRRTNGYYETKEVNLHFSHKEKKKIKMKGNCGELVRGSDTNANI